MIRLHLAQEFPLADWRYDPPLIQWHCRLAKCMAWWTFAILNFFAGCAAIALPIALFLTHHVGVVEMYGSMVAGVIGWALFVLIPTFMTVLGTFIYCDAVLCFQQIELNTR